MQIKKRTLAYILLSLNALIWGSALPIVKPALNFVSPYQYMFFRYLLAAPLTIPPLIILLRKTKLTRKTLVKIVSLEFLSVAIAHSLLYAGLSRTSSIEASLIGNAAPVFITLGGLLFLKEKEEKNELIGLILAITGITLITLEPITNGRTDLNSLSIAGNIMVLGFCIFWSTYVLLAKTKYKNISKLLISSLSIWVGVFSFGFLSILTQPEIANLQQLLQPLQIPAVFWPSLYMGVLGTAIAVPAIIKGNSLIEASEASLFTYLQPLAYIPLGVFWLKEDISPIMIVSILIIFVGVIIAEKRSTKPKKHKYVRPKYR